VFALPRSGGAAMRILRVPSAISPTISVFGDLGITFTWRYMDFLLELRLRFDSL